MEEPGFPGSSFVCLFTFPYSVVALTALGPLPYLVVPGRIMNSRGMAPRGCQRFFFLPS